MASRMTVPLPFGDIATTSAAASFHPVTGWGRAGGIGSLRSNMEMRGRFGLALVTPAYQTCNDRQNPDAAVAIPVENDAVAGFADADGVYDLNTTVTSPAIADKKEIRFGWLVKTSGAIGGACVGGEIEVMY